jgi:serine acetyltransferase
VLGDCSIGNNVHIASGAMVIDRDIPDNSVVFGAPPHQVIKENMTDNIDLFFIR